MDSVANNIKILVNRKHTQIMQEINTFKVQEHVSLYLLNGVGITYNFFLDYHQIVLKIIGSGIVWFLQLFAVHQKLKNTSIYFVINWWT